ncbi:hypothetical protein [Rheinheimera baltica]|uniref:hypothetical protein n=1 Tax=Rheinheimera baltica TaxID=67576 RepID=UPI0003F6D186|nr:hypothetical protein [Rheinheimera baltica]
MTLGAIGKSTYSKLVSSLISRIKDYTVVADSIYERATLYFQQVVDQQADKLELEQQVFLFENR